MAQNTVEFKIVSDGSRARSELKKTEESIKKVGKSARASKTEIGLAGAAVVATFGLITKSAFDASVEFESAFAGVRKTIDATEEEYAELARGIREKALEIPVDTTELSKIAELGGQLGIAKENVLDFTDTIAKLAVTTNLTAEAGALAFARIANIMQIPQEEISNMGSAVVDLGNNFATTEAEIVEFANRIAGGGKLAGIAAGEILGISTAFSSVGIQAEAGGSAVQKAFLKMDQAVTMGGDAVTNFAAASKLTNEEFIKLWEKDAAEAFTQFVEGIGSSGREASMMLQNALGEDVRLVRAFLSLAGAGDLLRRSVEKGSVAFEENNALNKEAAQRFATTESKIQLLKQTWDDLLIGVGDGLKVIFDGFVNILFPAIKTLRNLWGELSDRTKKWIKVGVAVVTGFIAIAGAIVAVKFLLGGIIAGFIGVLAVAGKFILIAGAIATVALIFVNGFKAIKKGLNEMWEVFKTVWNGIKTGLDKLAEYVPTPIKKIVTTIKNDLIDIKEASDNTWSKLQENWKFAFNELVTITKTAMPEVEENYSKTLSTMWEVTKSTLALMGRAFGSIEWGKLLEMAKISMTSFKDIVFSGFMSSLSFIKGFVTDMLKNMAIGFKNLVDVGKIFIKSFASTLFNGFKGIFTGIGRFVSEGAKNIVRAIKAALTGQKVELKMPKFSFGDVFKEGANFGQNFADSAQKIFSDNPFKFEASKEASNKFIDDIAKIKNEADKKLEKFKGVKLIKDEDIKAGQFFTEVKKAVETSGVSFKKTGAAIKQAEKNMFNYMTGNKKMTESVVKNQTKLDKSIDDTTKNAIEEYEKMRGELRDAEGIGGFRIPELLPPEKPKIADEFQEMIKELKDESEDTGKSFKSTKTSIDDTTKSIKEYGKAGSEVSKSVAENSKKSTSSMISENQRLINSMNKAADLIVTHNEKIVKSIDIKASDVADKYIMLGKEMQKAQLSEKIKLSPELVKRYEKIGNELANIKDAETPRFPVADILKLGNELERIKKSEALKVSDEVLDQYVEIEGRLKKIKDLEKRELLRIGVETPEELAQQVAEPTLTPETEGVEAPITAANEAITDTSTVFKDAKDAMTATKQVVSEFGSLYTEMVNLLISDNERLTENINTTVENAIAQFNRLISVLEKFRSVGFAIKATPTAPPPTITPSRRETSPAPAHSNSNTVNNNQKTQNISVSVSGGFDTRRSANELANTLARKIQVEQLATA